MSAKRVRNEKRVTKIDRGFLPQLIGYNIGHARNALWRDWANNTTNLRGAGQFTAMALISLNPGISQQQIAHELGLNKATIVTLIDQLEKAGLVERHRPVDDRRRHALHTTALGDAEMAQTRTSITLHEQKFRDLFSRKELAMLVEFLGRFDSATEK